MGKIVEINGYFFTKTQPDIWTMEKHAENLASGCTDLHAVYKTASHAKWAAYSWCENFRVKMNGYNGSVISGNTFQFTYGFYFPICDEETGEVLREYFCKVTANHNYIWEV